MLIPNAFAGIQQFPSQIAEMQINIITNGTRTQFVTKYMYVNPANETECLSLYPVMQKTNNNSGMLIPKEISALRLRAPGAPLPFRYVTLLCHTP